MNDDPTIPPPPPPPHGEREWAQSLPPRYQRGQPRAAPPPGKRKSSFWRLLAILFCLAVLSFFVLIGLALLSALGIGRPGAALTFGEKIGLVRIEGPISQSPEKQFWLESLRGMGENSRVKAIVVRIDSPGGTVGASQELYGAIAKLRVKKPVFVSMGDVAASGGYYLASAANRIFANKGTLTGSIGVIFSKPQVGELARKIGYQTEVIKSGRFKDSGSLIRPMTPEERTMFDFLINDAYQQFVSDVLQYRGRQIEQALVRFPADQWASYQFSKPEKVGAEVFLKQIADGRVYSGEQALKLGLIDQIGTLDDTVEALAREIHYAGKPELYEPQRKTSLRDLLKTKVEVLLPASHATLQYMMVLP